MRRWLGHGTMAILTVHGCGFYFIWLWQHEWLRGLVWDRNGTNMLAGEAAFFPRLLPLFFPCRMRSRVAISRGSQSPTGCS